MNPSALGTLTERSHTFTSPESFGLFMEALRDLQIYADDSAQSMPDALRLEEHLDCALEALTRCRQEFPVDLLPRYYLAITLTMKNQHLYAKSILQRIVTATSAQNVSASAAVSQDIVQALLAPRPWPLLDRAIGLFEQVVADSPVELAQAAQFNLAHVYAKRDGRGDVQRSLDLVSQISAMQPSRQQSSGFYPWEFLGKLFRKKHTARERAYQESVALAFQGKTLTYALQARLAIQNGNDTQYAASVQMIEAVRNEIDQAPDLNPETKHDLLADSCTKSGFVLFLHATRNGGEKTELTSAEASLDRALHYKSFWIPAQTYLAMAYVGQVRFDEAKQELVSVVGS